MFSFKVPVSVIVFGVPLWIALTIIVSYALAYFSGYSPLCVPWLTGCTDITHLGMYGPAAYVYRFGMIAGTAFLSVLWLIIALWGREEHRAFGSKLHAWAIGIAIVGAFSVAFGESFIEPNSKLILHTFFTGVFFATNIAAIFLVTLDLSKHAPKSSGHALRLVCMALIVVVAVLYILIGLKLFTFVNTRALEWRAVSFMLVWFASFGFATKGYHLTLGRG